MSQPMDVSVPLKITLPVPVSAAALRFEYADFHGVGADGAAATEVLVGGASAFVTSICVLCTLRTKISQSRCNFTTCSCAHGATAA
jgi:hypothetical protein